MYCYLYNKEHVLSFCCFVDSESYGRKLVVLINCSKGKSIKYANPSMPACYAGYMGFIFFFFEWSTAVCVFCGNLVLCKSKLHSCYHKLPTLVVVFVRGVFIK